MYKIIVFKWREFVHSGAIRVTAEGVDRVFVTDSYSAWLKFLSLTEEYPDCEVFAVYTPAGSLESIVCFADYLRVLTGRSPLA